MKFPRTALVVIGLIVLVAALRPTPVATQSPVVRALEDRVATLESQVAALQSQIAALQAADVTLQAGIDAEAADRIAADATLQQNINNVSVPQQLLDLASYVSVDLNTINDLAGPHIVFTGANVHIRNGLGATNGNPGSPYSTNPADIASNGTGNLIVGYNESNTYPRGGSHNLVVGLGHGYGSVGGLLAGAYNRSFGPYASISGGALNAVTGTAASVSGGSGNFATGAYASVSGGASNAAGNVNAWVGGGLNNTVSAPLGSIGGGSYNTASGEYATVSGGYNNIASHYYSTVSGGQSVSTSNDYDHVP